MKIKTNGFDVLSAGTVLSMGLEPIRFILDEYVQDDDDPKLHIILKVVFSEDSDKSKIKAEVLEENELTVTFYNPTQAGFGWKEHKIIGNLNGKDLYINFKVNLYGNKSAFRVTYSFLVKDDADE